MQRNITLENINPYLICTLCNGYLIDAATIVECLHSFCKSCLLRYLEVSYNCPKCGTEIHKTKPLEHIRSDPCLQEIVYKLVPELYSREESRRNKWDTPNTVADDPGPSSSLDQCEKEEDSRILVTLKYFRGTSRMERIKTEKVLQLFPTRYLCCQPEMPVRVLKKFVQNKFDISTEVFELDIWRGDETLLDDLSLKQLIQIYGLYRERKPLELHFSFYPKFKINEMNSPKPKLPTCTLKVDDDPPSSPTHVKDNSTPLESENTVDLNIKTETSEETGEQSSNTDIKNDIDTPAQSTDENKNLQSLTEQQTLALSNKEETLPSIDHGVLPTNKDSSEPMDET